MLDSRITAREYYFLWQIMEQGITDYLVFCTDNSFVDCREKLDLCADFVKVYIGAVKMIPPNSVDIAGTDYMLVSNATRKLTDHIDTIIDFPREGKPDYEALSPKFFHKFLELAFSVMPF